MFNLGSMGGGFGRMGARLTAAAGYPYENAEAAAYVAAMSVEPNDTRKALIDTFIGAVKAAGVWTKLDLLYLTAAHDEQAARLNLCSPGNNTLTAVNAPTFTVDRGFAGDAVSKHLTTGFVPSAAGGVMTQDSAHGGAWARTVANTSQGLIGGIAATGGNIQIRPSNGTLFVAQVNDATNYTSANASANSAGHFGINRSGATARQAYRNGAALGAGDAQASTALEADELTMLRHGATYSSNQVAAAHWGGSLTAGEWSDLYDALAAYMTAVGA